MSLGAGLVYTQWYSKRSDDHAPARLVAITSDDKGKSWSAPEVVQENSGKMNVMSASLVRTTSGKILLVYIQIENNRDANLWCKQSNNEVRTWNKLVRLSKATSGVVFTVNSAAVKLRSGRILVAAYRSPSAWGKDEHFLSYTYYSDDEGRTWKKSPGMVDCPKRGAMEPVVVELADGRVMMLMRTQIGQYSKDEGATWGPATPEEYVPLGYVAEIAGRSHLRTRSGLRVKSRKPEPPIPSR